MRSLPFPFPFPLPTPRTLALVAFLCVLAFAFMGARGLWEPDEGRYTNVALVMLDRDDWLTPMRNETTGHWTKPPMTYWLVASSVALFGQSAWAARLPIALAFLVCAGCVAFMARHLATGRSAKAAVVFATMFAPFGAAQLVTTDFPLAAAEAMAMAAFVQVRFGDARWRGVAWLGMWAAFGVAFLIKGPPGLLPLLAVAALAWFAPATSRLSWRWHVGGLAIFVAVALPWYALVVAKHDGLLAYFLGAEVLDRVASDRFRRNGGWFGWAMVYIPMLLLGTLPWTLALARWVRGVFARARAWRDAGVRRQDATTLLLVAWIALPLLVFCFAQSRLPLYVLPLFVPIALAVASVDMHWPRWRTLAAWGCVLLSLRLAVADVGEHKNAAAWASAIVARADGPVRKVVFVDDAVRWGLHLHLDAHVEGHTREAIDPSAIGRRFDRNFVSALAAGAMPGTLYVVRHASWDEVRLLATDHGFAAEPLGTPFAGRQVFAVRRLD